MATSVTAGSRPNFYGYWDHTAGPEGGAAFLGYVNVGKSLSVGDASNVVAQGIEVIPMVAGFTSDMTPAQWRNRLTEKRAELRALGSNNVRFILLIDEPYGAGFTVEQLEQIIDDARDIIDDPNQGITFRYGYTFTTTTVRWSDLALPQNADFVGINNYPFRVEGGIADTQSAFDADMQALLTAARGKKAPDSQIFIVGQAFYGATKWRQPPTASPHWYANWVASEEDIEGLLWFEWRSRSSMTGTNEMPALATEQVLVGQEMFALDAEVEVEISIDFEGDPNLYLVPGYRTKAPYIIETTTDVRPGTSGEQGMRFVWHTDGVYNNQYAYMVQDLGGSYDFSRAQMSYWHKQTNRSTWVGVALFSGGQLAAEWRVPRSTSWVQTSVDVATQPPWTTGAGSLFDVDAVGFMHIDTSVTGSGLAHEVRFDDFEATGVRILDPTATTVLSPQGGETLLSGGDFTIVWRMPQGVTEVVVEYSTDNGATWNMVEPANVGNAGFYEWQVPYLSPRQVFTACLVRVTDAAQPLNTAVSEVPFAIDSRCQEPLTGDMNRDCYVDEVDFAMLAASWLECNNIADPDCQ